MMSRDRPTRFGTAQAEAQARRDLRARVARLEAANAEKDAALREIDERLEGQFKYLRALILETEGKVKKASEWQWFEHQVCTGITYVQGLVADSRKARAALSDAGEGWPEAREQVREALVQAIRDADVSYRNNPEDLPAITTTSVGRLRAALDGLNVVK